jgi:hypothetical protein
VWYVTEVSCHSMCYFVHFDVGGCVSLFFWFNALAGQEASSSKLRAARDVSKPSGW